MTEKKFRGEIFEDQEKFDYGDRDILKNMQLEDQLFPPFKQFDLFQDSKTNKHYTLHNGLFTSGIPSGSFARCAISVRWQETIENDYDDEEEEESSSDEESQRNKKKTRKDIEAQQTLQRGIKNMYDTTADEVGQSLELDEFKQKVEKTRNAKHYEKINAIFPFQMFSKQYLKELIETSQSYKIRVTVLKCQNLSAVDNQVSYG